MSELSPSGHNTLPDFSPNYLGIDGRQLARSASQQRGMADLQRGMDALLKGDFFTVGMSFASGVREYEDFEHVRQVNRGAALGELLLADSVPGFNKETSGHLDETAARAAISNLANTRRSVALADRWELSPNEVAQNQAALQAHTDGILTQAGLDVLSFEIAVSNLNGPGLETPTDLLDAKYGAALVVLGFAANK